MNLSGRSGRFVRRDLGEGACRRRRVRLCEDARRGDQDVRARVDGAGGVLDLHPAVDLQIDGGVPPVDLSARNVYFNGDPSGLKTDYSGDTNNPVFDTSGFYFHDAAVQTNGVDDPVKQRADTRIRLANNVRYFPSKTDGLRSPALNLWDISVIKQVRVNDRVRAQFHVELLNAFNRTVYANPNTDPTNADFGKVTSQTNLPRDIQLAMKLVF